MRRLCETLIYLTCAGSDGKSLAAGGRSNLLHLWCLDSKQLVRVIQMPTQVRTVRQLEFLPDSFDGGASQVQRQQEFDSVSKFLSVFVFAMVTFLHRKLMPASLCFFPADSRCTEPGWSDALHQHTHMQATFPSRLPRWRHHHRGSQP